MFSKPRNIAERRTEVGTWKTRMYLSSKSTVFIFKLHEAGAKVGSNKHVFWLSNRLQFEQFCFLVRMKNPTNQTPFTLFPTNQTSPTLFSLVVYYKGSIKRKEAQIKNKI